MTELSGPPIPAEDSQDDGLLKHWHDQLTTAIRSMRDCGPLEAMQKLDYLARSAVTEGGAKGTQALDLAWVRVLAGPPESLSTPIIRAAGSLFILPARGPLLAHVYGDGFWPPLTADDPPSRFTDLQRRAILLTLADLAPYQHSQADTLHPILADWLLNRAIPLWRRSSPGPVRRILSHIGLGGRPVIPHPLYNDPEPAPPVPGLTLRELRSQAFVLGRLCPRDQEITYATILAHCPVPILNSNGGTTPQVLEGGIHAEFFRGWFTQHHQASLHGNPERIMQMLPTPFASDGHLIQRIAAELEGDFARRANPLKGNQD